jgi:MoxR-like ATPase
LAKNRGQIILEGEFELGKTMYLRHLAQHSTRQFAFLHATPAALRA